MDKINFLDLGRQYQTIKDKLRKKVDLVFEAQAFSGGPFVDEFEKEFAKYCHVNHAVCVNNGTNALHLALLAAGIKKGDEVIVPANTFIATAWAVSYVGAKPIFVDCNADDWEISPEEVAAHITEKARAIIGVHLYGSSCDIDALMALAKQNHLVFIEDAAQAHGALYKNKSIGGFGEVSCFSFYPGKNLGTSGEGGCVCTNNADYAEHMNRLRNHGSQKRYYHDEIGYNMRMGGVQAATLSVKLEYLDQWNQQRQEIAKKYQQDINNSKIKMQRISEERKSVYHLFVVTTPDRDGFVKYLNAKNIFPGFHYPVPCHLQKAYEGLGYKKGDCVNAEYLSEHCVSLPMYPELREDEVEYIIKIVNKY